MIDEKKPQWTESHKHCSQYYKLPNKKWVKAKEGTIASLWGDWVLSEKAKAIVLPEGFVLYYYSK